MIRRIIFFILKNICQVLKNTLYNKFWSPTKFYNNILEYKHIDKMFNLDSNSLVQKYYND